jgi:hypothetical protein
MKVTMRYARYIVSTLATIGFFLIPGERNQ